MLTLQLGNFLLMITRNFTYLLLQSLDGELLRCAEMRAKNTDKQTNRSTEWHIGNAMQSNKHNWQRRMKKCRKEQFSGAIKNPFEKRKRKKSQDSSL